MFLRRALVSLLMAVATAGSLSAQGGVTGVPPHLGAHRQMTTARITMGGIQVPPGGFGP